MIPWPIALVALLYTAIASSAWLMVARAAQGRADWSAWPLGWGLVAGMLVWGLVGMKPWARRLAVWTSAALMLAALLNALMAVVVTPAQPKLALIGTGLAAAQLVVMRYLTRPRVRSWFTGLVNE